MAFIVMVIEIMVIEILNMSNISFAIGMISYQMWSNRTVGTLIFDGF